MDEAALRPGQRVRIWQQIDRREGDWNHCVEGEILSVRAEKTGSWFAHAKEAKLWLNRVRLRKHDGEITTITVDPYTRVELIDAGVGGART
jgi:hypothetical protein